MMVQQSSRAAHMAVACSPRPSFPRRREPRFGAQRSAHGLMVLRAHLGSRLRGNDVGEGASTLVVEVSGMFVKSGAARFGGLQ